GKILRQAGVSALLQQPSFTLQVDDAGSPSAYALSKTISFTGAGSVYDNIYYKLPAA
ncbi:MAG: hypothetical protein JWR21_40, partial [Herminiimonas sp.]|nr:hypothetical protein [Herminiimonas sp.]